MSEPPVLEVRDVTKHYRMGTEVVRALDGVSRAIRIVTHDPAVARRCRRAIHVSDGKIVTDDAPA